MLDRNPGLTAAELSHKLGKSSQWIVKRISLNRIEDKKIQKLIDNGKIPLASAYALARLPVDEQPYWVDRAITMRPDNFLPLIDKRVWDLRPSARSEQQEFYNQSLGEPYLDSKTYSPVPWKRKYRRSPIEIIKIPSSGYELLHGKPKKAIEKKVVTEVIPIIRKGWDNVIVDGRIAYCRGDILIYKRSNFPMWKIKHPVLILSNDFNQPQYAMNFVEREMK